MENELKGFCSMLENPLFKSINWNPDLSNLDKKYEKNRIKREVKIITFLK